MANEETEAITVAAPSVLAMRPTTPRALVMAEALKEDTEQRVILAEYVEHHMTEGVDYGAIPGTPQEVEIFVGGKKKKMRKNNLLKPGAEKLLDLFRCRAEYEFLSRDVDRETGLYSYEIRCKAVNRETGTVLNEGLGSASSFESKHRYRNSERVCPSCGKPNIRKSKPPKEGWYCWGKTGGCDANFPKDDPAILDQEIGKMVNPDLADVANTVLKMAKKRAQVDCAIALARLSDIFAQDIEDLPLSPYDNGPREASPPRRQPAPDAPRDAPTAKPAPSKAEKTQATKTSLLWDATKARLGPDEAKIAWSAAATRCADGRASKVWTDLECAAAKKFLSLWQAGQPVTTEVLSPDRGARIVKIREELAEKVGKERAVAVWAQVCDEAAGGRPSLNWTEADITAVSEYVRDWKVLPVEDYADREPGEEG